MQTSTVTRNKNTFIWHFEKWIIDILQINTTRCNKLITIFSCRKNVTRPYVKRTQINTRSTKQKQHTIVVSFLHLMVLICKVFNNHLQSHSHFLCNCFSECSKMFPNTERIHDFISFFFLVVQVCQTNHYLNLVTILRFFMGK